ncbi:MAG: VCBS repeat-containing protein [Flavobacteriales bacterium]|nr:VCBS repeat-containing protein [Flavobacteriales bacterium]
MSSTFSIFYVGGESSGGVTMFDWDNDGWDDLVFCQNGQPAIFLKNVEGTMTQGPSYLPELGELKQIIWVDYDNDGDKDLSVTSHEETVKIFRNDNWVFTDVSEEIGILDTEYSTFGQCWGDPDNDGFLDLYINNYDFFDPWPNQFYHNNGDGTFTEMAYAVGIDNLYNFSFQSVFYDYDGDGWQDLFVINDRLYSENYLYHNNGDGTFEDVSQEMNVDFVIFSMTSTIGDYDNDGDFDIYVTNNPTGHLLHRMNEEGTYDEVADEVGVATYDMGWAAQWMDYDLDGWQDLHVNCSPFWSNNGQNKFFINNQDGTFTYDVSMGFGGDPSWSHSSAIGDVNNDGAPDIAIMNNHPNKCRLFESQDRINNYLKVRFEGVVSNRDGIGTLAKCYTGDLTQQRYTYCGEGYLTQNSAWEFFGLGQTETIDSLSVTWLSGHTDWFYDIDANQSLAIVEGSSLAFDLADFNENMMCPGDSIEIFGPEGFASYLWSNGDTTQSTWLYQEQLIQVLVENEFGIPVQSPWFQITEMPAINADFEVAHVDCNGDPSGSIEMLLDNVEDYTIAWSELEGDTLLLDLMAGTYHCTITDMMNCSADYAIEITEGDEIIIESQVTDVSCYGNADGSIALEISGGTGPVEADWGGFNVESIAAGTYSVVLTDSLGCMLEASYTIEEPEELTATLTTIDATDSYLGEATVEIQGGVEPYTIEWSNDETGETITDLSAGDYSVNVTDGNGCLWIGVFSITYSGIDELGAMSFSVYPNPTIDGKAWIESTSPISALRVVSLEGAVIINQKLNNLQRTSLSLTHLAEGMYIVEVTFADGSKQQTTLSVR